MSERLGPEDAGRTVEVTAGVPLVVALPETGGTGYTWQIAQLPEGGQVLGERYEHAPGAGIGAESVHVFEIDPGSGGPLRLVHGRPWLGEEGVLDRFELDVTRARTPG